MKIVNWCNPRQTPVSGKRSQSEARKSSPVLHILDQPRETPCEALPHIEAVNTNAGLRTLVPRPLRCSTSERDQLFSHFLSEAIPIDKSNPMHLYLSEVYRCQEQGTAVYDALSCLLMYYLNTNVGGAFGKEGRAAYIKALQSLQFRISVNTSQILQDILFATSILSIYEVRACLCNVRDCC